MQMEAPFEISELVTAIRKGSLNLETQLDAVFDCLQSFECWSSYFHILEQQIDNPQNRQVHHYVRIARSYAVYLEDINKASRICLKMIKDLKLSYLEFREKGLYSIVAEQDFRIEAIILQSI